MQRGACNQGRAGRAKPMGAQGARHLQSLGPFPGVLLTSPKVALPSAAGASACMGALGYNATPMVCLSPPPPPPRCGAPRPPYGVAIHPKIPGVPITPSEGTVAMTLDHALPTRTQRARMGH